MTGPEFEAFRKMRGMNQVEMGAYLVPVKPVTRQTITAWERKGPPAWVVSAIRQRAGGAG